MQAIDSGKHDNGKSVIAKVRGHEGGIPWMAILDADGKQLVTSDAPKGNIGCPVEPWEVEWFVEMVNRTKSRLTEADVAAIQAANEEFAKKYRRPR